MSKHMIEVVPVKLEPHPNADSLSIVRVYGYTVCVRTADWKGKNAGVYIPPDYVVPDTPDFAFLAGKRRIKCKRLRGVMSQGLLMPAPSGSRIGQDVMDQMGIVRYEPPQPTYAMSGTHHEAAAPPIGVFPKYDVESWHRYKHILDDGEFIVATEKLHGASGRWVMQEGVLFAGSRNEWKCDGSLWHKVITPELEAFLRSHPGVCVYGEVYGSVQDLRYGANPGQAWFRAFDLLDRGQWVGWKEAEHLAIHHKLPWVPVLYEGPYSEATVRELATGKSVLADHIREGCVIRPYRERTCAEIGRVQLKLVSDEYLERAA